MTPVTHSPVPRRKATAAEAAAGIFFFLATAVLAGTLLQHRLARRPVKSTDELLAGRVIVPHVQQEGVSVTPGKGRLLDVDSIPDGAALLLNGTLRGETPFTTDFVCEEGTRTVVELKKPGFQPTRTELDCVNGSTHVRLTMKRAR